jgi:hypothetical protein
LSAKNDHIDVLEWFQNSKYKFKCSHYAIVNITNNNHHNLQKYFDINVYKKMILVTTYLITIKYIIYNGTQYWFIYRNNKIY